MRGTLGRASLDERRPGAERGLPRVDEYLKRARREEQLERASLAN